MIGRVKSIMSDRGFGFIKVDETGKEYFMHRDDYTGLWQELIVDLNAKPSKQIFVEFEEVKSAKGPRAGNIRRLDD